MDLDAPAEYQDLETADAGYHSVSALAVVALVIGQGLRLTLLGLGLGLAGALLFARALGRLLFGVTSTDPGTFVAVVAGIAGVALLASYLPARRAVRVDPLTALRQE